MSVGGLFWMSNSGGIWKSSVMAAEFMAALVVAACCFCCWFLRGSEPEIAMCRRRSSADSLKTCIWERSMDESGVCWSMKTGSEFGL